MDSNQWPPKNGRTLYPLSYGEPHEERGHVLGSYLTNFLHTAWISNVDVLLCDERMKDQGCSWGGGGPGVPSCRDNTTEPADTRGRAAV